MSPSQRLIHGNILNDDYLEDTSYIGDDCNMCVTKVHEYNLNLHLDDRAEAGSQSGRNKVLDGVMQATSTRAGSANHLW